MSKEWYPIIDKEKCTGDLVCVEFCPNGVLEEGGDGKPDVVNPDACVTFCRGCQKICDAGAISYFGEDKGLRIRR